MCCSVSWRRSFHLTSSIRCNIWFCTSRTRHEWGVLRRTVGAIQLRDVRRSLELNAKTNAKLKLPSQRHTFWRRCQTSHQNTMLTIFLACITHPLVTMLGKMTRTSVFSEVNSKVQVLRPSSPWIIKSGELSSYMCSPTFLKSSRTYSNYKFRAFL